MYGHFFLIQSDFNIVSKLGLTSVLVPGLSNQHTRLISLWTLLSHDCVVPLSTCTRNLMTAPGLHNTSNDCSLFIIENGWLGEMGGLSPSRVCVQRWSSQAVTVTSCTRCVAKRSPWLALKNSLVARIFSDHKIFLSYTPVYMILMKELEVDMKTWI